MAKNYAKLFTRTFVCDIVGLTNIDGGMHILKGDMFETYLNEN